MELIGVVDPDKPSSVAPFLKTRHGGFITALGCENADVAYEAAVKEFPHHAEADRAGAHGRRSERRQRKSAIPKRSDGAGFPEARLLMIQHLTRNVIWRENEMIHPNGVTALLGAQFLVPEATEAAGRYGRLAGVQLKPNPGGAALRLGNQALEFFSDGQEGAPKAHSPSLFGAVFATADLGQTEALFARNGILFFKNEAGELLISPDDACGFALTFTTSDKHFS